MKELRENYMKIIFVKHFSHGFVWSSVEAVQKCRTNIKFKRYNDKEYTSNNKIMRQHQTPLVISCVLFDKILS